VSPQARRRVLLTASAATFANFLAFLGLSPLYPNVAHDLGLRVDSLGIYFGVSSAVGALFQIPAGVIADRVGRRPVMVAGIFFMALAQVLRWQASTPLIFGVSQLAIGLCSPFVVATSYAVVADAFATTGRASALGVIQSSISLGQVVGVVAAGLLGPPLGWRGFSLCVAAVPALLLPLALTMPEPPRNAGAGSLRGGSLAALRFLAIPAATALALVAAVDLGSGFTANYLLPFIAHAHGYGETATSLLLLPAVVGSVVGAPLVGRWADRVGNRVPLLVSLAVASAALAAFAVFGFSVPAVIVCFALASAGVSSVLSITAAGIAEIASSLGVGTGAALGGLRVGQQLGPALGPALGGTVYLRAGPMTAFLALAAALLLVGAAGLPATGHRPQEPARAQT
jgi:MFS transporter, DHA1 family, multidrug resistance protein